jgi:hypothetical protein
LPDRGSSEEQAGSSCYGSAQNAVSSSPNFVALSYSGLFSDSSSLDDKPMHMGGHAHSMAQSMLGGRSVPPTHRIVQAHSRPLYETHNLHPSLVPQPLSQIHVSDLPVPNFQVSTIHGYTHPSSASRHDRTPHHVMAPSSIGSHSHGSGHMGQTVLVGGYVDAHYAHNHSLGVGQPSQNGWPQQHSMHSGHNGSQYPSSVVHPQSRPYPSHNYSSSLSSLEQSLSSMCVPENPELYDTHLARASSSLNRTQSTPHAAHLHHRSASDSICETEWRPSCEPSLWQPCSMSNSDTMASSILSQSSAHTHADSHRYPKVESFTRSHATALGDLHGYDLGLENENHSNVFTSSSPSGLSPESVLSGSTSTSMQSHHFNAEKLQRAISDGEMTSYAHTPSRSHSLGLSHSLHGSWGSGVGQLF